MPFKLLKDEKILIKGTYRIMRITLLKMKSSLCTIYNTEARDINKNDKTCLLFKKLANKAIMKKDKMIIVNAKSFMGNASFSNLFIVVSGLPHITDPINDIIEPRCEKTDSLHMRKQRRRSASR